MVDKVKYLLVIVATILCVVALLTIETERTVVYNCELAEISPDFPPEVRAACRKMRYEQWKKANEIKI